MKIFTVDELLKYASDLLLPVCGNRLLATQESLWILEFLTGKNKSELLFNNNQQISNEYADKLSIILDQRIIQNKPLAYIIGNVPFCNLNILVEPPVLIPRPETEEWVSWLISILKNTEKKNISVLDLCCGSGCVGLAIAKALPESSVLGIDISEHAIKLGNLNKIENQLNNIQFLKSDMFECLPENFSCDLIVANPPYLSAIEYSNLDLDVRYWEDKNAFVADNCGMIFYENILLNATNYLNSYSQNIPSIILEIGPAQANIEILLQKLNYKKFEIHKDIQSKRRWLGVFLEK